MYKKLRFLAGLFCAGVVVLSGFQNCSKATFNPPPAVTPTSESSSSSSNSTSSETTTSTAAKIVVCDDGSCVDTGEQKVYFNNLIGVSLKVGLVQKVSDKIIVVSVRNLFNPNAIRKSNLRLELKKNGYVFLTHEDPNKPWLCLDANQSAGATINNATNCSSQVIMTGTKQKVVEVAQSYQPLTTMQQVPGLIAANNNCPAESCLFLPNANLKFVVNDLAGSPSGMMIESAFKPNGETRYKLVLKDLEGRSLTMYISDPATGFSVLQHVTLFDQRDHGYLCHEPKSPGLAIIKKTSGDAVNCFSSIRYNILNGTTNAINVSGSIPFVNTLQQPANTSLWAVNDDRYFSTIIKESF